MKTLLREIVHCTVCAQFLPHGPRPVLAAGAQSRIVIIGQAPGRKVHESGVPWQDRSGDTLRIWLKRNAWFEAEVIPDVRARVARILRHDPRPL